MVDKGEFSKNLRDSKQLRELFDIISANSFTSDKQIMGRLYSTEVRSSTYKKLKQRLRDKLTEYIVQNGVSNKNLDNYARMYRKCMNQTLAVKTLMQSHARAAGAYIAENLIKTTTVNEYTDLSLILARELAHYYSAIAYNKAKHNKFSKLLSKMQILYNREIEVDTYYCDLRIAFNTSRGSIKEDMLHKAIEYSTRVRPYIESSDCSYQLLIDCYEILTMRYEIEQDYEMMLKISQEAIDRFRTRRVSRLYAFFRFDINKIICHIQYGQNKEVLKIANSYFNSMTSGGLNWYALKIYVLVSQLHTKEYDAAYQTMSDMRDNRNFDKLPSTVKQTLLVYEAHVEFLKLIGKINTTSHSKFRLYKFLNEIPVYTKDKRGLNISILILHVLFLLQQKKYLKIIDRVDALNQYCHRHLRRDHTFRSNCFIKMLLQLPRGDFNFLRIQRYAEPYIRKLSSMPLQVSEQSIEVEIIPYEHLWEMVLEML